MNAVNIPSGKYFIKLFQRSYHIALIYRISLVAALAHML
jgi:hypothetical protein